MKNSFKHELLSFDKKLFESMRGNYVSKNEENFFKNIQYKQEFDPTAVNDLLVSEYENPDEIYIVREEYEEYVVGHGIGTDEEFEEHTMCLADALALNLHDLGYIERDLTLLEWLRETDYAYVNYQRNYDHISDGECS
jgi:hypothetical protein